MQKIVYIAKFKCELCKKEVSMPVHGDIDTAFTPEEEIDCIDWSRHFHWTDFHRVCAVCGKIVRSGDLEVTVNDGQINIAEGYTNEYKKIERGDRFGTLLIVHTDCIKK